MGSTTASRKYAQAAIADGQRQFRSGTRRARTPLPLTVVYCFFATVRCWMNTTIISSTVSTTAMAAAAFCRDGEAFISR